MPCLEPVRMIVFGEEFFCSSGRKVAMPWMTPFRFVARV